jgi:glycosyltransferase involved in cell wall biosynthesis
MVVHAHYPVGEPRVQREAEALVDAGAEVDVICLRDQDEASTALVNGVRIYRLPVRRDKRRGAAGQFLEYLLFFALAFAQVTSLHLKRRYHVVQAHNLPDFLVFTALIPRLMGAAVLLDLHDLMPEFFVSRFGGRADGLAVHLVRLQERLSCRFANHVITVTQPWRDTLIKRGVPLEKCSVVMNVADSRIFTGPLTPRPSRDGLHLMYHGTLTYRYGVDLILQVLAQIRQRAPNVRLTIHGRGEFLSALQQMAEQLHLNDIVTFSTRLVPMEELPRLLAEADVGLAPYRNDIFTDGILPTKLMEYAALGLPCIAARTTAVETYFRDTMVEFFAPGDMDGLARCILKLYDHREHLAELAQGCERFNRRYNWPQIRAEYLALVRRLGRHPA